ncbi:class I SAM-dependent methyltransferase [Laribacter hongkongensis]|uniref:class I SAM-dependent methyltransferase n=1 Tax=Laribacter hongkongensis TaxID=168471 RepID=UPI001EFCE4F3|nr:methyltransferase domain-containing protein [Laribacter hongkongensis]MCG9054680.1 class I SAM-dependent methyltransferase [Laribacter hongkongensis]
MNHASSSSGGASPLALSQWLASPLGRYVLAREQAFYDKAVADCFGYRAVQLGWTGVPLMRCNRIPWQCLVGQTGLAGVQALPYQLPFATRSLDLLLMPHTLDFSVHPRETLREAERVLAPEGRLVLTGFNPVSLFGLRRVWSRQQAPWNAHFLSLRRLKDWLELLDFDLASGAFLCYAPPTGSEEWRSRFRFMESAGDRWWPAASGVYALHAIKRVRGMRLIRPSWSLRRPIIAVPQPEQPAVTSREGQQNEPKA